MHNGPVFRLGQLDIPILIAPMAGGPTTIDLVRAAARAGAFGFLDGGYRTPDALAEARHHLRGTPHGVNLFVPEPGPGLEAELRAFRRALMPLAEGLGVAAEVPEPPLDSDDWYEDKLALLLEDPPAVASFTFGLPSVEVVDALHAAGCAVFASIATVADAEPAVARGVDALIVQGPDAGGHRATLTMADAPGTEPLGELLAGVGERTGLPLVAAGGLTSGDAIRHALDAGAAAVQCGTAFLLADEAGTAPIHRAALQDASFDQTVVTRAFTGRPARGLANAFTRAFEEVVPASYPAVHLMTRPIRRAAASGGDAQHVHLWAGSSWPDAVAEPAERIIAGLWANASDRRAH